MINKNTPKNFLNSSDGKYSANFSKAVQMSNLDDDTKELVSAYIEAQDEPEPTDKIHHKKKIAKALEKIEINDVIIPCRILNDRQCGRFPCAPLCTRVQGL